MNEIMDKLMYVSQDIEAMKAMMMEQQRKEGLAGSWIDGQDVMLMLHISKRKLQTLRDNGTLPFARIGRKLYYKVGDVKGLLDKSFQTVRR